MNARFMKPPFVIQAVSKKPAVHLQARRRFSPTKTVAGSSRHHFASMMDALSMAGFLGRYQHLPIFQLGAVMGNANSRAVKVEALRPGDHIFIWDRTNWPLSYQHHGIVWAFSGAGVEDVRVCHVWTPLEGFRQAQSDSSFRVSTLEQFLYHRSVDDLRVVEHDDTKLFRGKADRPKIVLARCRLLLGRGRGDYHPITQNCEHAARWCKTGRQRCSQTLTPGHGRIPFEDQLRKLDVLELKHQVAAIKMAATTSTSTIECVKPQLRVKVSGRTLFWLDSFSAEVVHVRKGLARRVYNWPPTLASICHFRLKSAIWTNTSGIAWEDSSEMALKMTIDLINTRTGPVTWSSQRLS